MIAWLLERVGFLYLRYMADPKTLWNWYEPYVKDDEEFSPGSNGQMTTMGVYIRDLLLGQYYFDTLFPRIPIPVLRQVVSNLEKLKLPTAHCGTTGETTRHGSDDTARRPPSVKAALSVSFGQRAPHRASTRDSSPIRRNLPPPPHERNGIDDTRRSPNSRCSQSREYPDRDRDRDRSWSRDRGQDREGDRDRGHERDIYHDRDRDRHHDRDRNRDRGQERDRERYRDQGRDHDRDRIRRDRELERERERSSDYDRRSKFRERESSRDYDGNGSRHRHSRSRSRSRSRSQSLLVGTTRLESHSSPMRDANKTSASSNNLAKLKDIYGDLGDNKRDANMERIPRRDNGGEEVIRLGGSTWKY
ncbi:PREDICTED: pre-mRNA-splicing factor 38B-like isoform X3 [Lupinus angustifolius]|uniref:pre-mRNA-splicing factor 38B-like isoform X3 n=1 Tax=Lupinus angustifolius TaxID=3871 RepID=UPI00092F73A5|nr:PREDICTED: pre-mRNA-splicing factor 38B-like isoform X3 [Lupinus angustifolius]